jgi:hypothetical protein
VNYAYSITSKSREGVINAPNPTAAVAKAIRDAFPREKVAYRPPLVEDGSGYAVELADGRVLRIVEA